MNALRLATSRIPAHRLPVMASSIATRSLTAQTTVAVHKLRGVLEEYRQANYTQCIPSRFKKDIVCAAADTTPAGLESSSIAFDGLHRVLHNIGADNRLADEELKAIIQEMGDANGQIPAKRFYQIL